MDIGIVIVNWNVRGLLAACLDSVYWDLAQSVNRLTGTVCVVDNASTDGSAEMVRAQFPRTLLIEGDNIGMGAGNNVGLRALGFSENAKASAPFAALILNPDTLVKPGALGALVECLRAHPRAGVVAPKLLNPDGSLQHSGFRFPGLIQTALDLFPPPGRLNWLMNSSLNGRYPTWAYGGAPFRVDHTLGAAFAVRAEAMAAVGLFDETFHMYCEEIDWQWRMAQAGWERWVAPAAEIVHYGGQSTAQIPAASLLNLWKSRRRLYLRYYRTLPNALMGGLVAWAMHRRIRANHRLSQLGKLSPDRRAELNLTLAEIVHIWREHRPPR